MTTAPAPISHALVLPDADFMNWYRAVDAYTKAFERVAVVRSPRGNDLNRFRNVTAVQAPGVWQNNDAVRHIRTTYPSVVRVDLIRATTPAQLTAALAPRIAVKDRYGETLNPQNIFDRFVLDWPAEARPARIVAAFNALTGGRKNEGVDCFAPKGSVIRAGVDGTVAAVIRTAGPLGYGQYVQVSSVIGGTQYLVTYAYLQNIKVAQGARIKLGDVIGESGSALDVVKIVVQQPGAGLAGYVLPNVVDPTMLIYWTGIRLRTTASTLRIREKPGTTFNIVGTLRAFDRAETLEPHGRTLVKVTQKDQWIRLRSPSGVEGYASAEYLIADERDAISALNMTGMNIDLFHPLGKPAPERLKGIGWVRFPYNVSQGRGSQDLNAAHAIHAPWIERYAKAGLSNIIILTHQTFGEGAGYVWPSMDSGKWREFTARFQVFVKNIALRYASTNWIKAYQIWNEQDTDPKIAHAAVSMPPADYAYLLAETIKTIRSVDARTPIITGGHVGGPGPGATYARAVIKALPSNIRPDGIAVHSYGRGVVGNRYSPFGAIDDDVNTYGDIMPGAPVWITEWGVLDLPNDPARDVADYASLFISRLKRLYGGRVATACWYGWADGMHNGYGLVDPADRVKEPLYSSFLKL